MMDGKTFAIGLISDVLRHEGIALNPKLTDSSGVYEYLKQMNGYPQSDEYTIYDYIQDTKENYPEYFM